MKEEEKTKQQLIDELAFTRRRIAELEEAESERKRVSEALLKSEEKYRSLVESTSDWVWEVDERAVYTYAGPQIKDLLGYEPEEVLGKTPFDFMPPDERERVSRILREAARLKAPLNSIRNANIHKSGRKVDMETNAVPIVDTEGNLLGYRGIDRDITKRRQTEAKTARLNALKERLIGRGALSEKLGIITEAAVQIHDADFARIWITKEGDLCEKGCSHVRVTEGPHVCRDRSRCLHLVASSGRYTHLDGNHRRVPLGGYKIGNIASGRDASFLTNDVIHDPAVHNHEWAETLGLVSFAGFRLISPDGDPIGVLALFRKQPIAPEEMRLLEDLANTTSQVIRAGLAEEALRENENRFKSLVLNSSDTITVLAADGTVRYQSPSLKRFFGYEPEDLLGKNAFPYVHPDDLATAQAAFSRILEQPGTSVALEYRFRHANGSWVFVESIGSSFLDDPGINGVVLNSRDISERKRAEDALEKRIVALTQPLDAIESIAFEDLFNLNDLQRLQDLTADAWGVAALITRPDGTPVTQPSNFSYLCSEIIRKDPKGLRNCRLSDAVVGQHNPTGPNIQLCLSAGLCNAGASITVSGRHIANWLIGQVRNEAQSEEQMMEYARELGVDETAFREAFCKVPIMPQEKFERIAHALFALANQLSTTAYQNIQQARFIAERRKAERALLESQQMLRSVLDTIPVRVFWKNLDSVYLGCNGPFARDAGLQSPEAIIGKTDFEMGWEYQAEVLRLDDRLVMESGRPRLGRDEPRTMPDGGRLWLRTNKIPLLDAEGRIKGVLGTYEDITERKRAEEAVHAASRYARSLIEASLDPLVTISVDGKITDVNSATETVTGYDRMHLIGTDFSDYFTEPARAKAGYQAVFREGSVRDYPLEIRHRDGQATSVLYNASVYRDEKGQIVGVFAAARDITELKRAERALQVASEKLKLFAYSVAHDLKSPAIGVYGLSKRLSKTYKDILDEKGRIYCDQIMKTSEHIAAMVDKINAYITTKEAPLSIERINIAEIIRMLKDEFSTQLSIRRIDWLEPEATIEIKADRLSILRVFRNFVDNSLKYGGESLSKIWTEYESSEDSHIFSFSDNGKGLKEGNYEKIFSAFQRYETSKGVEGAGLGLTIVKEIAERHGGKVWVESKIRKRTTFYISISKNL